MGITVHSVNQEYIYSATCTSYCCNPNIHARTHAIIIIPYCYARLSTRGMAYIFAGFTRVHVEGYMFEVE